MLDVLIAYNSYRGTRTLTPEKFLAADVEQDGRVNMWDVLLIYDHYRGIISSFDEAS